MRLPIRTRLTVWYTLFLAVLLVLLGLFLVLKLRSDLRSTVDRSVRASSGAIAANYTDDGVNGFHEITAVTLRRSGDVAQILDVAGHVTASYGGDLSEDPMISQARQESAFSEPQQLFQANLGDSAQPYRLMVTHVEHAGQIRILVVAGSLEGADEAARKIIILLLIAGPIALAAAAFGGWWVVRNALLPVERMRRKAERIGIDHLHERLTAPDLSDEIGQLARTLNAMLDRLEAGVMAKRQLIADASHELRTPLATMRSEIDVSLREPDRSDRERAVLESLREDVDRMSRTVDNLLTLARADEGQLELMTSDVDLRDVAAAAVDALRPLADAKGVRLTVDGEHHMIEGDPQRLRQAVMNLIENAVEFTPPAGSVTVSSWRMGAEVGITVADTGAGIPDSDQARVFDRFYRVDPSRSRQTGGSGLGLAICYEIAAAHGGRIWVQSEVGAGSRFSIGLPAVDSPAPAPDEPAAQRVPVLPPR
jgi:heavy metal sensor kinase